MIKLLLSLGVLAFAFLSVSVLASATPKSDRDRVTERTVSEGDDQKEMILLTNKRFLSVSWGTEVKEVDETLKKLLSYCGQVKLKSRKSLDRPGLDLNKVREHGEFGALAADWLQANEKKMELGVDVGRIQIDHWDEVCEKKFYTRKKCKKKVKGRSYRPYVAIGARKPCAHLGCYAHRYPDLREQLGRKKDVYLSHWQARGQWEGLSCDPCDFDPIAYASRYTDVPENNPLKHWNEVGGVEGRNPHGPHCEHIGCYAWANPSLRQIYGATLGSHWKYHRHWLLYHNDKELKPCAECGFDNDYYTTAYPDVEKKYGNDGLKHFNQIGGMQGRRPFVAPVHSHDEL